MCEKETLTVEITQDEYRVLKWIAEVQHKTISETLGSIIRVTGFGIAQSNGGKNAR